MTPTSKTTENIVAIDNLTKVYDGRTALDGLTLKIPENSIFGLLGPNGAGKTTLLRILTGLLLPTTGSATLFGGLAPGKRLARRQIGYMPQSLSLYQGLSVEENLIFYGRIYGVAENELPERVDEALAIVELSDRRNSVVTDLSGGMIRRALLGTALVHKPKFLLLDEPTAGVDPLLRIRLWDTFRNICDMGASILITTHHISEADRCDRVVFLRHGKLVGQGAPTELMERYGAANLEKAFVTATSDDNSEVLL